MKVEIPQKMLELFEGEARYRVAYGGRGSGKTESFGRRAVLKALEEDMVGMRILCCRELQKSTKDSVHRILISVINELQLAMFFEWGESFLRARHGADFIFRGLKSNIDEIKSLKDVKICWIEEGHSVSKRSWEVLDPTIREKDSEIWISFNPDQESDPIYQFFVPEDKRPPDAKVVNVNWRDNPWFPEVLERQRVRLAKVDIDAYMHVWEGDFNRRSASQVFSGKWSVESFDIDPEWDGPYDGADWGFAEDPTTRVRCYFDLRDVNNTVLYISQEVFGYKTEIPDIPELFTKGFENPKTVRILGDCSRPETISYLSKQGFNIGAAEKWAGSVEEGIEWIRGFDKIIIHPSCVNVIQEFKLYSYKTDRLTGDILPIIIDKHNHGIDAIRYACQKLIRKKDFGFTEKQIRDNMRIEKTTEAPDIDEVVW